MSRVVWFDGYVDGWPTSYPTGIAETVRVALGANDRAERLTALRALRHPLVETFGGGSTTVAGRFNHSTFTGAKFGGNVTYLYPLQEDSLAVTAGDVTGSASAYPLTVAGVGGDATVEFGQSGILPEGTMVKITSDASYLPYLSGDEEDIRAITARPFTAWVAFAVEAGTPAGTIRILRIGAGASGRASLTIEVTGTTVVGKWQAHDADPSIVTATATVTDTVGVCDGKAHVAVLTYTDAIFGLQVDNRTQVTTSPLTGLVDGGSANRIRLGNYLTHDLPVYVAWAGFSPTVIPLGELATMLLGLPERSDVRIRRYLNWCGIPDADMDLEVGAADVGFIPTTDVAALDAIAQVNDVELGVFHVAGDRFVQHNRSHRASATPVLTLTGAQCIPATIDTNRSRLANDWTVTRPGGVTYRAINQGSIAKYGRRVKPSATLAAARDADLRDIANSVVQRYGEIEPHCPTVEVDLLTLDDDTVGAVMRLEVGDLIHIVDLPATAPGGGALALFVEGGEMSVSVDEWRLTLATSPAGKVAVTRFDDPNTAQFDTSATFAY